MKCLELALSHVITRYHTLSHVITRYHTLSHFITRYHTLSHAHLTVPVFSCGDTVSCIQGIPLQNIDWDTGYPYWGIPVFNPLQGIEG